MLLLITILISYRPFNNFSTRKVETGSCDGVKFRTQTTLDGDSLYYNYISQYNNYYVSTIESTLQHTALALTLASIGAK